MPWPHEIVGVARRIIEAVNRPGEAKPPSPLRLDQAILARSPVEEAGPVKGRVLELYSRPLVARRPRPQWRPRLVVGVDSGSRSFETPGASFVVSAVSVSSNLVPGLGDHPGLLARQLPGVREAFVRILPNDGVELDDGPGWVSLENPAGHRYHGEYSLAQAMDEARVALENAALHTLAEAGEGGLLDLDGALVLVDGPLYPATTAIYHAEVREEYREAWRTLLASRIEAVERLERLGARVAGVVKRIQKARLIPSIPGLRERVEECAGQASTDLMALHASLRGRCAPKAPGRVYATPAFTFRSAGVPERVARYAVVPASRGAVAGVSARFYRVETTLTQWAGGHDPLDSLLADSVARGSQAPVTIALSDRRARTTAGLLQQLLYTGAVEARVPASYSSELEVIAGGWRA